MLYLGLALTAGLTVAHTLIPPTPGPMAVASLLELDLGRMLMINLVVGLFAMSGGVLFVIFFVKNTWLDYDKKLQELNTEKYTEFTNQNLGFRNLLFDLLPILVPIILIGSGAFIEFDDSTLYGKIGRFISLPLVARFYWDIYCCFPIEKSK